MITIKKVTISVYFLYNNDRWIWVMHSYRTTLNNRFLNTCKIKKIKRQSAI